MLDRFGIGSKLVERGLICRQWQFRDRNEGVVATFDLSLLEGLTNHPYRLQCEQWKLSEELRSLLEGIDLIQPSQVLRKDDVAPPSEVSRRHRQSDRPQDLVRVVADVLPATDQLVQPVDVQVEGAGMSFRIESGERGLPDSRRAVQVNEGSHRSDPSDPRYRAVASRSDPHTRNEDGGRRGSIHRGRARADREEPGVRRRW